MPGSWPFHNVHLLKAVDFLRRGTDQFNASARSRLAKFTQSTVNQTKDFVAAVDVSVKTCQPITQTIDNAAFIIRQNPHIRRGVLLDQFCLFDRLQHNPFNQLNGDPMVEHDRDLRAILRRRRGIVGDALARDFTVGMMR